MAKFKRSLTNIYEDKTSGWKVVYCTEEANQPQLLQGE
jgi:hypothetical protein